jgi:hypothetical protein
LLVYSSTLKMNVLWFSTEYTCYIPDVRILEFIVRYTCHLYPVKFLDGWTCPIHKERMNTF